jgi:hypothetical protein
MASTDAVAGTEPRENAEAVRSAAMSEVLSSDVKEASIEPEGLGGLLEEPGSLDEVVRQSTQWFLDHLNPSAERA